MKKKAAAKSNSNKVDNISESSINHANRKYFDAMEGQINQLQYQSKKLKSGYTEEKEKLEGMEERIEDLKNELKKIHQKLQKNRRY